MILGFEFLQSKHVRYMDKKYLVLKNNRNYNDIYIPMKKFYSDEHACHSSKAADTHDNTFKNTRKHEKHKNEQEKELSRTSKPKTTIKRQTKEKYQQINEYTKQENNHDKQKKQIDIINKNDQTKTTYIGICPTNNTKLTNFRSLEPVPSKIGQINEQQINDTPIIYNDEDEDGFTLYTNKKNNNKKKIKKHNQVTNDTCEKVQRENKEKEVIVSYNYFVNNNTANEQPTNKINNTKAITSTQKQKSKNKYYKKRRDKKKKKTKQTNDNNSIITTTSTESEKTANDTIITTTTIESDTTTNDTTTTTESKQEDNTTTQDDMKIENTYFPLRDLYSPTNDEYQQKTHQSYNENIQYTDSDSEHETTITSDKIDNKRRPTIVITMQECKHCASLHNSNTKVCPKTNKNITKETKEEQYATCPCCMGKHSLNTTKCPITGEKLLLKSEQREVKTRRKRRKTCNKEITNTNESTNHNTTQTEIQRMFDCCEVCRYGHYNDQKRCKLCDSYHHINDTICSKTKKLLKPNDTCFNPQGKNAEKYTTEATTQNEFTYCDDCDELHHKSEKICKTTGQEIKHIKENRLEELNKLYHYIRNNKEKLMKTSNEQTDTENDEKTHTETDYNETSNEQTDTDETNPEEYDDGVIINRHNLLKNTPKGLDDIFSD